MDRNGLTTDNESGYAKDPPKRIRTGLVSDYGLDYGFFIYVYYRCLYLNFKCKFNTMYLILYLDSNSLICMLLMAIICSKLLGRFYVFYVLCNVVYLDGIPLRQYITVKILPQSRGLLKTCPDKLSHIYSMVITRSLDMKVNPLYKCVWPFTWHRMETMSLQLVGLPYGPEMDMVTWSRIFRIRIYPIPKINFQISKKFLGSIRVINPPLGLLVQVGWVNQLILGALRALFSRKASGFFFGPFFKSPALYWSIEFLSSLCDTVWGLTHLYCLHLCRHYQWGVNTPTTCLLVWSNYIDSSLLNNSVFWAIENQTGKYPKYIQNKLQWIVQN